MDVIKVGPEEYRKVKIGKYFIPHEWVIGILSGVGAVILVTLGIAARLYQTYETLALLIVLIFATTVVPILFYKVRVNSIDRKIEERYPSFLRDLSESLASGMTLVQALRHISNGDYGPLTPFVRKLYTWLSWGMEFTQAFERFNKFFRSKTIIRANYIILEAYREGGNIEKVLKTVANDLESIRELEKLKKSYVSQQVMVLYIIFVIFIGLIVMLKMVLQPMIAQQVMLQGTNTFGFSGGKIDVQGFKIASTLAIMIEGICIAFVIGVAETGRVSSSFKHLLITSLISLLSVLIFILPQQVSLQLFVFPKTAYVGQQVTIQGYVTIDASPGTGTVKLTITGPASVDKLLKLNKGQFRYIFTPNQPGNYNVEVVYIYNGKKYSAKDKFTVR